MVETSPTAAGYRPVAEQGPAAAAGGGGGGGDRARHRSVGWMTCVGTVGFRFRRRQRRALMRRATPKLGVSVLRIAE